MHGLGIKRLTDEDRAKIVRLYRDNLMTQALIAKRFGVHSVTIAKVLRKAGISKPNRRMDVL